MEVPFRVELEGLEGGSSIVRSLQVILDGLRVSPFQVSNAHIHVGTGLPEGNEAGDIGDIFLRVDKGDTARGLVTGNPALSTDLSNTLTPTLYTKVYQNGTSLGWAAPGAWQSNANTQTGTQNDWEPSGKTLVSNTFIIWTGTSDLTVSGFKRGYLGQQILVRNNQTGASVINFKHASTNSLYGNRLYNFTTSADTVIATLGSALFQYDGTQWVLVNHDQGTWITPAFAAGNYTANGAQTWTLTSGDVSLNRYIIKGTVMHWQFLLLTTTVGGTPNTQLRAAIPGGMKVFAFPSQIHLGPVRVSDNGGAYGLGACQCTSASSQAFVEFYTGYAESGNWTGSTNATAVQGNLTLEVI